MAIHPLGEQRYTVASTAVCRTAVFGSSALLLCRLQDVVEENDYSSSSRLADTSKTALTTVSN